jgi:hypothetical protein
MDKREELEQLADFIDDWPPVLLANPGCNGIGDTVGAPDIIIAKIPTRNPWEVTAWIPDELKGPPTAAEKMAVFKYWNKKYGAVPFFVSGSHIILRTSFPPISNDDALSLAKEQLAFCRSLNVNVKDGEDEFASLARKLKISQIWHFSW